MKMPKLFYHIRFQLLLFSLTVNFLLWILLGLFQLKISPDGYYYLSQATYIENEGLIQFLKINSLTPYYWGFPIYIYLNQLLFGIYFKTSIIAIQFLLTTLIPVILAAIYALLFKQKRSFIVVLFFVTCFDVLQWSNFLLTDLYSLFLVVLFIAVILNIKRLPNWFILVSIPMLCGLLMTFRMANLMVLIPGCIYSFIGTRKEKIAGVMIILMIALLFSLALFSGNQSKNPFSMASRYHLFTENLKSGEVINDRPQYDLAPWKEGESKYIYASKLYATRAINYWRFYSSSFSFNHNLYNGLYFSFYYFFILFYFFDQRIKKHDKNQRLLLIIIILYFMSTVFTMIDYDWRYRVPALSLLILFAVRGFSAFCSRLNSVWLDRLK